MTVSAEVQAAISRYLTEVSTHLGVRTPEERRELLADLESHIHEALAARSHEATLGDLEMVLAEMAPPESYATAVVAAPPAGPRVRNWGRLGGWALGLAIGGLVLIFAKVGHDQVESKYVFLAIVLEILAFILGMFAWKDRLGKIAVVVSSVTVFVGTCVFA